MENENNTSNIIDELTKPKVTPAGYISFILAVLFFSGIFNKAPSWIQWFDFLNLMGQFGALGPGVSNIAGTGGTGVRYAFMFSLTLIPGCAFATGVVNAVEGLGGLKAGQRLLNPLLKPLIGIPGWCSLSFITHLFASSDSGAVLTVQLVDNNLITEKELGIYSALQMISPCVVGQALVYSSIFIAGISSVGIPLIYIIIMGLAGKLTGGNLMRLYINLFDKKTEEAA